MQQIRVVWGIYVNMPLKILYKPHSAQPLETH